MLVCVNFSLRHGALRAFSSLPHEELIARSYRLIAKNTLDRHSLRRTRGARITKRNKAHKACRKHINEIFEVTVAEQKPQ